MRKRAQQRLLHQIVGAIDVAAQRDREGAQTWHRRQNLIADGRILVSCRPIIFFAEPPDQVGDMGWYALTYDVVVHRPQLLADARLSPRGRAVPRFCGGSLAWPCLVEPCLVGPYPVGPDRVAPCRLGPAARASPAWRLNVDCLAAHFLYAPIATVRRCKVYWPRFRWLNAGPRRWFRAPELFWELSHPAYVSSPSSGNRRGGASLSMSQAVVQHLPFLRRYARALTGSQTSGMPMRRPPWSP